MTHRNIKPDLSLWGVTTQLERIHGGRRNLVFRTIGLPADLVFKSTRRTEDSVAWLGPIHDIAERLGLCVPRNIKSKHGNYVESGWTAEPFIKGKQASEKELASLKELISEFHFQTRNVKQRPDFASATDLGHLDKGGDVDLSMMPKWLVEKCRKAWTLLEDQPTSVIHGDLNQDNVLVDDNGRFILLDWDEARRDAAVFDIAALALDRTAHDQLANAFMAWEIACSWVIEPDYAKRIAEQFVQGETNGHIHR